MYCAWCGDQLTAIISYCLQPKQSVIPSCLCTGNIIAVRPHAGPPIVSAGAAFLCRMSQGEYLEYQFHL